MDKDYVQKRLKNWWLLLLSGILFVLLSLYIFRQPLASYVALSVLFAATFLVAGIFDVVYAVSSRSHDDGWGWALFGGILHVVFGIFLISFPVLTATVLPIFVGSVILIRSLLAAFHAFSIKRAGIPGWGWVLFSAVIGIFLAVMMLANPVFGGFTIIVYTAVSFFMLGIVQIVLSLRLKAISKQLK